MSEENLENITKSNNDVAPTFADYHLLPDMSFSGHSLIKKTFVSMKIHKSIYFVHTTSKIN